MALHQARQLRFFGNVTELADARPFARWLAPLRKINWVVYAKPPFGGLDGRGYFDSIPKFSINSEPPFASNLQSCSAEYPIKVALAFCKGLSA